MSALVTWPALRAFLTARGADRASSFALSASLDGTVLVPEAAVYRVDGQARPLAEELLEVPALTRLQPARAGA